MAKRRKGKPPPRKAGRKANADPSAQDPPATRRPRWDSFRRKLWLGEILVKRYRRDAWVVDRILSAFEKQGWPVHIDDPLERLPGRNVKNRLRQAIHSLNGRLPNHLIWFAMDGHGLGITWRRGE